MKHLTHWLKPITRLNVHQTIRILKSAGLSRYVMEEGMEIYLEEDTVISSSGILQGNPQYPYIQGGTSIVNEPDRASLTHLFYVPKGQLVFQNGLLSHQGVNI